MKRLKTTEEKMSYPAACRAYGRRAEELKKLLDALRKSGVNVQQVEEEFNKEHHKVVMDLVKEQKPLCPLIAAGLSGMNVIVPRSMCSPSVEEVLFTVGYAMTGRSTWI